MAWESTALNPPDDFSVTGVYHRVLDASAGTFAGPQRLANTYTVNAQQRPAVTGLSTGDYVVAWDGEGPFSDTDGIYGRWFEATPPMMTG